jgi:hypothetical protein
MFRWAWTKELYLRTWTDHVTRAQFVASGEESF